MARKKHELMDLKKLKESEVIPNDVIIFEIGGGIKKQGQMTVRNEFVKDVGKMVMYYLQANPSVVSEIKNTDKKSRRCTSEQESSCLCEI